jgi:hypothetical protein
MSFTCTCRANRRSFSAQSPSSDLSYISDLSSDGPRSLPFGKKPREARDSNLLNEIVLGRSSLRPISSPAARYVSDRVTGGADTDSDLGVETDTETETDTDTDATPTSDSDLNSETSSDGDSLYSL